MMRPIPFIAATALGLLVGIVSTWFLTQRLSGEMKPMMAPEKKVLYWYDPMVPNQHFDQPGKSPFMDMQLVPKYAGTAHDNAGVVSIDPRQVQNLGVRTVRAEHGVLNATVRATGTLAFDERAVTVVQARVAGIVEHLEVRALLTAVRQGQPLLTLLAPDWTAAQEEYLALRRMQSEGLNDLRIAARQRLLLLGMSDAQIRAVERNGQAQTRITVTAPRGGVIGELSVREGASVMAGTSLLRINGLDTVWVNAAIPETKIGQLIPGAAVEASLPAFPGKRFTGQIETLLAEVDPVTRTQTARIVLNNAEHRLAPGMFAQVDIAAIHPTESVLIPTEAVIATGMRTVVIVMEDEGRFRAQEIRLGKEAGGKSEVLEGMEGDETVVLSGQFLIDSEASLIGALTRLQGNGDSSMPPSPPRNTP